jgi:uncharacterized protein
MDERRTDDADQRWDEAVSPATHPSPRSVVALVYDAMAAGDHERLHELLAPGILWRQAGHAVPAAGAMGQGVDAFVRLILRPLEVDWEDFSEQIEHVIEAPDGHVVVTGDYTAVNRGTGNELRAEFCHLWHVEHEHVTSFRQYTDTSAFALAKGAPALADDPVETS